MKINAKNYICINGKKTELTKEQLKQLGIIAETFYLSDDGLKCYGTIKSKMSLLTSNMVRENVEILDEFKLNAWWWTCTPYSTPKHENASWIKCVSPRGGVIGGIYNGDFGVRPFCIVKSSIFVS